STKAELEQELSELREEVWYPDLIEKAIRLTARKLKSGRVSLSRQVRGFYKPALELQEQFDNPPLIKYALEQTLNGPVFQGEQTNHWHRYALAVAKNNRYRFRKASDPEPAKQAVDEKEALRRRELEARETL